MPITCCAVDCNHSKKNGGCKLKRFPTDPVRAAIWEANLHRDKWIRKSWHLLCECHFDSNQWEANRQDGQRKLRPDAIPFLFSTHSISGALVPEDGSSEHVAIRETELNSSVIDHVEIPISDDVCRTEVTNPLEGTSSPDIDEYGTIGERRQVKDVDTQLLVKKIDEIQRENWRMKKELASTKKKLQQMVSAGKPFRPDQLASLSGQKVKKWCKETVRDSLQIRYAVGVSGYNFLIAKGWPLVSYSALCRRVQKLNLHCGISMATLELLEAKALSLNATSKKCVMSLDEMEVRERTDYDPGMKCSIGNVTLGNIENKANKLLLLVIRGLSTKWKQIIGWHLTDDVSVTGSILWEFIQEGIQKVEAVGYDVEAVVFDMGHKNQAVLREANVKVGRYTDDSCSTVHPVRPCTTLLFFADVPHLLKNLRSGFLSYDLTIPQAIVQKYDLPTDKISHKWILDLLEYESKLPYTVFRTCYHLNASNINISHYDKMKVGIASKVFSEKTAVALEIAIQERVLSEDARTTAWFIRLVSVWFRAMTSRVKLTAITIKNYERKRGELLEFVEIVRSLKAADGRWKPYQSGIILSTKCILELAQRLFQHSSFGYLLSSRLTQDALENLFSVVRSKGSLLPSPLQALRAVRLITVSQYSADVKGMNYSLADDTQYLDFLKSPVKSQKRRNVQQHVGGEISDDEYEVSYLHPLEKSALDNFVGSVLHKCEKYACDKCRVHFFDKEKSDPSHINIRDKGGLCYPSASLLQAGCILEDVCSEKINPEIQQKNLFEDLYAIGVQAVVGKYIPTCDCRFLEEFCKKFIRSRVYFTMKVSNESQRKRRKKALFASRSGNNVHKKS